MLTEQKKKMSLDEFMQLPYERAELIDGVLFVNEPSPTYGHQQVELEILTAIKNYTNKAQNGKVLMAPLDVFLGEQCVQPDILFVVNERIAIIENDGLHQAPDVVFEIVSFSNVYRDTKEKFDLYERYGVKEYFIVFPDDKTVFKYSLINGEYEEQYRKVASIQSDIIGCEFNF
ncbi:MAG: hypothetical protein RLZZ367_1791 [Bacteroidota bacterium]|jgi:Uma2 family endonuclease